MKTTVINLFAGPGAGKSTVASEVYSSLKRQGKDVELVREYVKDWVWEGKKIGKYDQPYIFGKQSHAESRLYGKVKYIVTDSPFFLSPFYEQVTFGTKITLEAAKLFMRYAMANDVSYFNFFLPRQGKYISKGRLQTSRKAKELDRKLFAFLDGLDIPLFTVNSSLDERAEEILAILQVMERTPR